jgi:DNA-3-methyladenine glycosylase
MEKNELPGRLLTRAFFEAPPERVARRLLGKILVRKTEERKLIAGRIVEVEAYLGPHQQPPDPAAHSHRGPTPRNQVLFGPAGHAYVYSIYGLYFCMNVSCEGEGHGGGVLIRALEPVAGLEQMARNRGLEPGVAARGLTSGPGRLCQALGITRCADDGLDLLDPRSPLQLRDDGARAGRVLVTPRIGIRHAAELPLRFAIAGNGCVSGPKSLGRACFFPRSQSVNELNSNNLPESAQKP